MLPGLLLIIPLIAAIAIIFARADQAKWIALGASLITFIHSMVLATIYDKWGEHGFGLTAEIAWLPRFGITLDMGADSVSMLLILLTTLLMPLCIYGSFSAVHERVKEYYGWMMVLGAAMVGVFLARDLIFFYICFEFTLVPMFFLIAIWGGSNRTVASVKFFIFTFTGSLIALAGLLYITWRFAQMTGDWSFEIEALSAFAADNLSLTEQSWLLLALMIGFAVKIPLFPVHTWLPLAHTEAPTAGSVLLAAVLLKLGTYGVYRFTLPMLPDAVIEYAPAIAVLSIIGILYAALICWVQTDIKRLIAYSSVSHLGFCVLGLFALNPLGMQGSVLYMINHGLSTGALFFLVGMIYERYHTRDMNAMGGLARKMPIWAFFMVFFVLASVGLPGLNGFVSEFLCLMSAFVATADNVTHPGVLGPWYAAFAGIGMIAAAMYLLIMVGKVVFGELKEPAVDEHLHHSAKLSPDLTAREITVLAPLAILCVVLGLYPKIATDAMEESVQNAIAAYPDRVRQVHVAETSKHPNVQTSRASHHGEPRRATEGEQSALISDRLSRPSAQQRNTFSPWSSVALGGESHLDVWTFRRLDVSEGGASR